MKKKIKAVKKFHKAFGIGYKKEPVARLEEHKLQLRFDLMQEENEEYLEAAKNDDLVEVADALGDMLYIEVFDEIQRSNMSKLGADGKPIYREDGKVMKGPNYFRPNIAEILEK